MNESVSYWIDSNVWTPRFLAWIILLGSAVHVKGLASVLLCSAMNRLIAACRSTSEWKTPYFSLRRVSLAKKSSTALSRELDAGVKWKVQWGCQSSHARTSGIFWAA